MQRVYPTINQQIDFRRQMRSQSERDFHSWISTKLGDKRLDEHLITCLSPFLSTGLSVNQEVSQRKPLRGSSDSLPACCLSVSLSSCCPLSLSLSDPHPEVVGPWRPHPTPKPWRLAPETKNKLLYNVLYLLSKPLTLIIGCRNEYVQFKKVLGL